MAWYDSLISPFANTVSQYIAGTQKENYKTQNQFQKDFFDYTFNAQNLRQDNLNANQALTAKNSMLNAGLNPSMTIGAYSPNITPNTGTASSPTPANTNTNIFDIFKGLTDVVKTVVDISKEKSEKNLTDANTIGKKIENEREHSYDVSLSKYKNGLPYIDPDDGEIHFLGSNFANKGDFMAYYDSLNNATNFITSLSNSNADVAQNKLRKAVAEGQLQSNSVLDAIINKPSAEFTKLKREASKLWQEALDLRSKNQSGYWSKTVESIEKDMSLTDAQIDMLEFQKKLQSSESFIGLVDSIKDPNLSTGDKWAMVGAYFMNLLGKALGAAGNVVSITKKIN